jgi:endoglucanase
MKTDKLTISTRFILGLYGILCLFLAKLGVSQAASVDNILIDQVGYLPHSPKIAVVLHATDNAQFFVLTNPGYEVVFAGNLEHKAYDSDSGDTVQISDFSAVVEEGSYVLNVAAMGNSFSFSVGSDIYRRPYYLNLRSFYGMRAGMAVDLEVNGEFEGYSHGVCHQDEAYHRSSGKTGAVPGEGWGWHDAGDFGRYMVNSGFTMGLLLGAFERFPASTATRLDIPESGGELPDLLAEVKWNLDWALRLQDTTDGGVYHKQTSERFPGYVLPEDDGTTQYVIGTDSFPYKGTCATADFAAVMAMAGRLYEPYNAAFASRALSAARAAFEFVLLYPRVLFHNPSDVVTGEYGDGDCGDEVLWAAAELYRTTQESMYDDYFLANYQQYSVAVPEWPTTQGSRFCFNKRQIVVHLPRCNSTPTISGQKLCFSFTALAFWGYVEAAGADEVAVENIHQATLALATSLRTRTNDAPLRHAMSSSDYNWGSNSRALGYAMVLTVADAWVPDGGFGDAALDQLHYVLGRNVFSMCFLSAVGSRYPLNLHHRYSNILNLYYFFKLMFPLDRPSAADQLRDPWPGLLSGGPNSNRQDPIATNRSYIPDATPAARHYVDHVDAYSLNENAINWSGIMAYVLAAAMEKSVPNDGTIPPSSGDSGLTTAGIAGIAIGAALGVGVAGIIVQKAMQNPGHGKDELEPLV